MKIFNRLIIILIVFAGVACKAQIGILYTTDSQRLFITSKHNLYVSNLQYDTHGRTLKSVGGKLVGYSIKAICNEIGGKTIIPIIVSKSFRIWEEHKDSLMTLNLIIDRDRMPSTVNYFLELKVFKPGVFEAEIAHGCAVKTKKGLKRIANQLYLGDSKVVWPKSAYDITAQAFSTLK